MPAKTAPATATPTAAATPDAPAFDFGSVKAVAVPVRSGNARTAQENPFVQMLRDSFAEKDENKKGRAITVPVSVVKEAVYKVRSAANTLATENIGSRVAIVGADGTVYGSAQEATDALKPGDTVTVEFSAKPRKARKAKDAKNGAQDSTQDGTQETPQS